jgi:hypothetical protein
MNFKISGLHSLDEILGRWFRARIFCAVPRNNPTLGTVKGPFVRSVASVPTPTRTTIDAVAEIKF